MFGSLGGPELFLILVVALIVFGPRKLPDIGKSLGKMMAEFRKASNDFRRTIEEEVEADKLREATRLDTPFTTTRVTEPAPVTEPASVTEPAPVTEPVPAAAVTTTENGPQTVEAPPAAPPRHEPVMTVSREALSAPEPVEPK
jgi:Tat protein translocase TatB subunit